MGDEKEGKTEVLPIRLTKSTKAEWENNLKESKFDTLAGAIRGTMEAHFPDDPTPRNEETPEVDLDPIKQKLNQITDQLDRLQTQLTDLQTVTQDETDTDILHLSNQIARHIPYVDDPDDLTPLRTASTIDDPRARAGSMGTADALADAVAASESTVRRALSVLEDDRSDLETVEEGGFTRYYFVEEDVSLRDSENEDGDE